jgi:hypothetical protein
MPDDVNGLPLPRLLLELIASGVWPRPDSVNLQNGMPWVPLDRVHRFAPDENGLYFYPPPFELATCLIAPLSDSPLSIELTMGHCTCPSLLTTPTNTTEARLMYSGAEDDLHPPGDIDFELAVVLGDFGPGTDAPIVLDYRVDRHEPRVLRLSYAARGDHHGPRHHPWDRLRWVTVADTFAAFSRLLEP